MTTLFMTGATGFAGNAVINEVLKNTNWKIVSFQRKRTAPESLAEFSRIMEVEWDFRESPNIHQFNASLLKSEENFFLHLGADVHAMKSLQFPDAFVMSNVVGTQNVLHLAKSLKIQLFCYVSTGEVLGGCDEGEYRDENSPLRPSNPYAATKAAGELLVHAYHRSFDLPAIIVRTMNIWSMDQIDPTKFVPIVKLALASDSVVKIHTKDGRPGMRQWLHVTAFANQLLNLLKVATIGETYHLVGEELTSLAMAKRVADEMGKELKYELIRMPKTHEHRYAMTVNK